jgi:selenocysteine lyase/cysteine desulfurase
MKKNKYLLIDTPYGSKPMIDCDAVASGSYKEGNEIDKFMNSNILPYYNNTHSNSHNGKLMCEYIELSKKEIRDKFNLKSNYKIVFTGYGCTEAINHAIHLINLPEDTVIVTSLMEHHSNLLPWKKYKMKYIDIKDSLIDLEHLENVLSDLRKENKKFFCTFSGCSNVTGIIQPVSKLRKLTNTYGCKLMIDYAAVAPYIKINSQLSDIVCFSGHKFANALNVPGVLIINKNSINSKNKLCPGGGSIRYMTKYKVKYNDNLEKGGTPNILGIIRFGKILSETNYDKIKKRHKEIKSIVKNIDSTYNLFDGVNLKLINDMKTISRHNSIPIYSFFVNGNHYNLFVKLLNDLFGIQSRGGVSCASLLAQDAIGKKVKEYKKIFSKIEKNQGVDKEYGWCRVHFWYGMTDKEINYVLLSIIYISKHIDKLKDNYIYNKKKNNWFHKNENIRKIGWNIDAPEYKYLNLYEIIKSLQHFKYNKT